MDDQVHALAAIGRAWAVGLPVELEKLWHGWDPRRVTLPTYAFQHQRYFIEQETSRSVDDSEAPLLKTPDIVDWGYKLRWKQSLADYEVGSESEIRSWLVFLDDGDVGKSLSDRLRSHGHRVVTVSLGDAFAKRGRDEYIVCPEDGRSGYDALMSGLGADGGIPSRIVHLWLLTQRETFRPGSNFFHRNQEYGLYCLLYLAKAVADAGLSENLHFTIAANGMQRVDDEPLPYPEKATVLGPAMVIPKEMPGASVTVIDLDLPVVAINSQRGLKGLLARARPSVYADASDRAVTDLWEEIFASPSSETIAYRRGRRWRQTIERLSLEATGDGATDFRQNGVYLFTGGFGDLPLAIADELVHRFGARIVLVGRTPLPDRDQWQSVSRMQPRSSRIRRAISAVAAMEAKGAEVLCLSADVSNPEEMRGALATAREKFGEITGVFHAAGIVNDELIQLKTLEGMEVVLTPKVHGTVVLDELLAEEQLDFLVLFASTSTETAPAGQVDYVAANAFLNAYAESRAGKWGRKTVALHWGVWNEIGIAARATGATADGKADALGLPAARGPLFERWVEDSSGMPWLEVRMSPQSNWMLNEHRLVSGKPVLPGTGYLELIAQAAREYELPLPGAVDDLLFLRPLVVIDGEEKLVRVRFERAPDGYRVFVVAGDVSGEVGSFHKHAEATFRPFTTGTIHAIGRVTTAANRCLTHREAPAGTTIGAAQEGHIHFGPRWQVLHRISVGEGEAVADLKLPANYADDVEGGVTLHPALVDIATGFAMELITGYDCSDVLWAPVSYGSVLIHRPVPAHVRSWARLTDSAEFGEGYATFDVVLEDFDGAAVLEVKRFLIKRLDDDVSFAASDRNDAPRTEGRGLSSSPVQELAAIVRQGILPSEGFEALTRALASGETQPIVSSIELDALRKRASAKGKKGAATQDMFARPDLENDYVAPRNEIEAALAGYWRELLGVEQIGVHDSFFDIGGHSLIAVRLFRMIKKEFGLDFPISVLFEAPTIALCGEMIAARMPKTAVGANVGEVEVLRVPQSAPTHLVAMHAGKNVAAPPFFLCAGMFGNVLNLRHLALHIGTDRPVYGLQARGLYGDQEPHETFETMAKDYLAEVRAVQPHGPYLLGGFSGGGLTAYEMARQLIAEGEEVAQLILLDTPQPIQPRLSKLDLAQMKLQDMRREGLSFLGNWVRSRIQWEEEKRRKRNAEGQATSADQFDNLKIEAAFRRALPLYQVKPFDGAVTLFRPKPEVLYRLSGGRRLQPGRNIILDDNGWSPFVKLLDDPRGAGRSRQHGARALCQGSFRANPQTSPLRYRENRRSTSLRRRIGRAPSVAERRIFETCGRSMPPPSGLTVPCPRSARNAPCGGGTRFRNHARGQRPAPAPRRRSARCRSADHSAMPRASAFRSPMGTTFPPRDSRHMRFHMALAVPITGRPQPMASI